MPHDLILRKKLFTITITSCVLTIGSFSLAAWSLYTAHNAAVSDRLTLCTAENDSNLALRRVLVLAQQIAESNPKITPDQKERSALFYAKALPLVGPVPCSTKGNE